MKKNHFKCNKNLNWSILDQSKVNFFQLRLKTWQWVNILMKSFIFELNSDGMSKPGLYFPQKDPKQMWSCYFSGCPILTKPVVEVVPNDTNGKL